MTDFSRLHTGLSLFGLIESEIRVEPASDGYINDTFKIWVNETPEYILQRISPGVFGDGAGLMQNLELVLPHLKAVDYTELELVRSVQGKTWEPDSGGSAWRMYRYIKGSHTHSASSNPDIAKESGRIIGRFHQLVEPVNPAELYLTLPRFHDLNWRAEQLEEAVKSGIPDRIAQAGFWIAKARNLISLCAEIPWDKLPVRVCHNDTKLSNILFREDRAQALCLIDLDTVMPGYFLYDVGDAVRTLVYSLPEDYREWENIKIRLDLFRPFVEGIKESGLQLTVAEWESLHVGPVLLPLLHGIRALADFLIGDKYYKTAYPDQNLVRARSLVQVASLTADGADELRNICSAIANETI